MKSDQENIKTVNYPKTIKEIKLKWYPKFFTKSKFPWDFFPLYLYLWLPFFCAISWPVSKFHFKTVNSCVTAYAVLKRIHFYDYSFLKFILSFHQHLICPRVLLTISHLILSVISALYRKYYNSVKGQWPAVLLVLA